MSSGAGVIHLQERLEKIRMVERQKQNFFCHLFAASAPLLLAVLSSCGSPAGTGKRPAAEQGDPVAGQVFRKIGNRPLTDLAAGASFVASRCLFQDGNPPSHVAMNSSLQKAPAKAREELTALLSALQQARTTAAENPSAPENEAVLSGRIYQLHPQSDWIIDLSIGELPGAAGQVQAACNLRNKGEKEIAVKATAPMLVRFLREEAAAALLDEMKRPRVPLEQHYQALAGFLDTGVLTETELKRTRRLLIARLGKSRNKAALVSNLLAHLDSFDETDMAALDSDGSIAPRVFYLAWSASRGTKKTMRELLVLSLEYHGDALLFQRALTALFAEKDNPGLYALNPPGKGKEGALAFLRGLRKSIGKAGYHSEKGWLLKP
tara:strand:+ start:1375 stop:2511 length:1137 start_codon:yes stop_codon:yes gene_type:complete